MANGRFVNNVGSSARPKSASGAHIFSRHYYRHFGASGDVRGEYKDLEFTGAGSGETVRLRAIANGTGVAGSGTANALHATGRLLVGKTVGGALNAARFTIESNSVTNAGTLAAIQVDSSLASGATYHPGSGFIRVTNSGTDAMPNLFVLPAAGAASAYLTSMVVANHDTSAPATFDYAVRCYLTGYGPVWLHLSKDTPND